VSQPKQVKGGLAAALTGTESGSLQVAVQMHDHTMLLAGVPAKKFYFDAKTNIENSVAVSRYYEFDMIAAGLDLYNIEIEALGGKMIYGENSMPTIDFRDPLIKKPEDLAKLKNKKLDFRKVGRFPFILELSNLMLEYGFGTGLVCSPFSMAVGMRGFPALYKDMRKNPKFYDELMTYIVDDVLTPWIKVQNEETGNLMITGADAWACIPNLSNKEMMDWVVPYNQRLTQNIKKFGALFMSVSGDYCEERLEKFDPKILHGSFDVEIASQGAPVIFLGMGRWQDYPLEAVREYTAKYREQGKKVTIMAGVNARLLRDGPADKIIDTVKRYIETFGRDHDLTIFLANIPADTPSDHIHAAVAAVHQYGKLPISENLDKIELKIPKKESFKEWIKKKEKGSTLQKVEVRRGLAGLLWKQMEPINRNAKFKELYKDTKLSILYNLTDQSYGALITVDNGKLDVKHVKNDKETLQNLKVDASMACSAELFFDFGAGKLSKMAAMVKMLTGKLKIKGMKQMQELGKIMALLG
jgi:uroporphyrinogen-III decarboxylase/putative sterol carrier protein